MYIYIKKCKKVTEYTVSCPDLFSYRWIGMGIQISSANVLEQGLSKDIRLSWKLHFNP